MVKKIKIVNVIYQLNRAGAETLVYNISNLIDDSKFDISFLVHKVGYYDKYLLEKGFKVFYISKFSLHNFISYIVKFKFIIRKIEPDIIHCHMDKFNGLILFLSYLFGIKSRVSHSHSQNIGGSLINKIAKIFLGLFINKYSTLRIACSIEAGRFLYRSNNFTVLLNGIDTNRFIFDIDKRISFRKSLNLENKIIFGHVGRFNYIKNHRFIISLFKDLSIQNNDFYLVLVGEGKLLNRIQIQIEKYNLFDKVKIFPPNDNIDFFLNAFDYFIFPSIKEGLGLSLIEAQCSSLTSFVSTGVPREAIITDNTFLIPLSRGVKFWSSFIFSKIYLNRETTSKTNLAGTEFDIFITTKNLEELYLSQYE